MHSLSQFFSASETCRLRFVERWAFRAGQSRSLTAQHSNRTVRNIRLLAISDEPFEFASDIDNVRAPALFSGSYFRSLEPAPTG